MRESLSPLYLDEDYSPNLGPSDFHFHGRQKPTLASQQKREWFWDCIGSWSIGSQRALLRYLTGFSRVHFAHVFELADSPSDLTPYSDSTFHATYQTDVGGTTKLVEHVLYLPTFKSKEAMEATLLHIISQYRSPADDPALCKSLQRLRRILSCRQPFPAADIPHQLPH